MTMVTFKISSQFSEFPAGRYPEDGPFNGERFREEIIIPLLSQHDQVTFDLDGTEGYGSSFLDEAFGGLVRHHNLTLETLRNRLHFIAEEDDSFIDEIWEYIATQRP